MKTELVERLKALGQDFIAIQSQSPIKISSISADDETITVHIHNIESYDTAVEIMRSIGIQKWNKSAYSVENPWGFISGEIDNICFKIFFNGLPNTCRIIEKDIQIPKTNVVETGEFITIKQKQIVCG